MPLRDHFHSPLADRKSWEELHGGWPMTIVQWLFDRLPHGYSCGPKVHHGAKVEIDVATFEDDQPSGGSNSNGGTATALWSPAKPSLAVETEFDGVDEYEVNVYDARHERRLVAAIEIVSPANKDRPGSRRTFVDKCRALIRNRVSVIIVDVVTDHHFNLYHDLLDSIGRPAPAGPTPTIYACAFRNTTRGRKTLFESWNEPLTVGSPLPTLPLWLDENLAIPLALEESYENACRVLSIR